MRNMMLLTSVLCMFWSTCALAKANKPTAKQCSKVQQKINRLDSRLRQGYGVKQGEVLKAKLRKVKQLRYQCQKYRIPIS